MKSPKQWREQGYATLFRGTSVILVDRETKECYQRPIAQGMWMVFDDLGDWDTIDPPEDLDDVLASCYCHSLVHNACDFCAGLTKPPRKNPKLDIPLVKPEPLSKRSPEEIKASIMRTGRPRLPKELSEGDGKLRRLAQEELEQKRRKEARIEQVMEKALEALERHFDGSRCRKTKQGRKVLLETPVGPYGGLDMVFMLLEYEGSYEVVSSYVNDPKDRDQDTSFSKGEFATLGAAAARYEELCRWQGFKLF